MPVLPLAVACSAGEEKRPPVVGTWTSGIGSIQFLEGGELGEVSLLPAACLGEKSSTPVQFTGTWKHGSFEDAGTGAWVTLTSASGALTCETYFQYFTYEGQERLQLTGVSIADEPFIRQ
ncbi:hypothetical protein ABZW03_08050 [Kitasatospora sp. NPDC004799]|uniref:hypothetical protein n=1 Tax=Kitasatospora sp. NPDC004799 TaxID=3154460 RepID=UPI0033B6F5F7